MTVISHHARRVPWTKQWSCRDQAGRSDFGKQTHQRRERERERAELVEGCPARGLQRRPTLGDPRRLRGGGRGCECPFPAAPRPPPSAPAPRPR